MIKLELTETAGWEPAIRGMRNPMNSWAKSDSATAGNCENSRDFHVGPNDLDLMRRLRRGGSDDRKYMRMLVVYVDITAPLYWWKEFDTYKVGTVANSCSTMHKIHARNFTWDDFSDEHLLGLSKTALQHTIKVLNEYRDEYVKTKDKRYWWQMIQLLPTSYNQRRTVMMNYEVLTNMYHARKHHKLDEWHEFCRWVETLPYARELIVGEPLTKTEE